MFVLHSSSSRARRIAPCQSGMIRRLAAHRAHVLRDPYPRGPQDHLKRSVRTQGQPLRPACAFLRRGAIVSRCGGRPEAEPPRQAASVLCMRCADRGAVPTVADALARHTRCVCPRPRSAAHAAPMDSDQSQTRGRGSRHRSHELAARDTHPLTTHLVHACTHTHPSTRSTCLLCVHVQRTCAAQRRTTHIRDAATYSALAPQQRGTAHTRHKKDAQRGVSRIEMRSLRTRRPVDSRTQRARGHGTSTIRARRVPGLPSPSTLTPISTAGHTPRTTAGSGNMPVFSREDRGGASRPLRHLRWRRYPRCDPLDRRYSTHAQTGAQRGSAPMPGGSTEGCALGGALPVATRYVGLCGEDVSVGTVQR